MYWPVQELDRKSTTLNIFLLFIDFPYDAIFNAKTEKRTNLMVIVAIATECLQRNRKVVESATARQASESLTQYNHSLTF